MIDACVESTVRKYALRDQIKVCKAEARRRQKHAQEFKRLQEIELLQSIEVDIENEDYDSDDCLSAQDSSTWIPVSKSFTGLSRTAM